MAKPMETLEFHYQFLINKQYSSFGAKDLVNFVGIHLRRGGGGGRGGRGVGLIHNKASCSDENVIDLPRSHSPLHYVGEERETKSAVLDGYVSLHFSV